MIYGIGVDMSTNVRLARSIEKESFVKKVFANEEWAVLAALPLHRRIESASACFAAKEAFLKAAGVGLGGFALRDIAALRREGGAPYYKLFGTAAAFCQENQLAAHLSLTHENGQAVAFAVLEHNSPD